MWDFRLLKILNNEFHPWQQMESERTARELMERREIRENVSQALASLPMSSLLDVDQISSALAQSTVSEHCPVFLLTFLILVILVILQNTSVMLQRVSQRISNTEWIVWYFAYLFSGGDLDDLLKNNVQPAASKLSLGRRWETEVNS